jgi:predicted Fe-Mo cluster-binding NifX family protein
LDDIQALITGDMETGLVRRLPQKNIRPLLTKETDPDQAIQAFLNGTLKTEPFEPHQHEHGHH